MRALTHHTPPRSPYRPPPLAPRVAPVGSAVGAAVGALTLALSVSCGPLESASPESASDGGAPPSAGDGSASIMAPQAGAMSTGGDDLSGSPAQLGGEWGGVAQPGADMGERSDMGAVGDVGVGLPPPVIEAASQPTLDRDPESDPLDPCGDAPCALSLEALPAERAWLSCGESVYVNDPSGVLWRVQLKGAISSQAAALSGTPVACLELEGGELTGAEGALTLFWLLSDQGEWSTQLASWGELPALGVGLPALSQLTDPPGVSPLPLGDRPKDARPAISVLAREWRALPPVTLQDPPAPLVGSSPSPVSVASLGFVGGDQPAQPRGAYEVIVRVPQGPEATPLSLNAPPRAELRALAVEVADREVVHIRANDAWRNAVSFTGARLTLDSYTEYSRSALSLLPIEGFKRVFMSMQWVAWQTASGVFLRALRGPTNSAESSTLSVDISLLRDPVIEALSDDLLLISEPSAEGVEGRWFAYDLRARRLLPLEPLLGAPPVSVWLQGRWLLWAQPEGGSGSATQRLKVWRLPVATR